MSYTVLGMDPKSEYLSLPKLTDESAWPHRILNEVSRTPRRPFGSATENGANVPWVSLVAPDSLSPVENVVVNPKYDDVHGFIASITQAWDDELPLALKPDHFWLLVLQGVAAHVTANAEELRGRFVKHDGQNVLRVLRDGWVGGPGTEGYDWAGVATELTELVDANTVDGVVKMTATDFTTSTPVDVIAGKMTTMSALQKFFSYRMCTKCGFPEIQLEGTQEDWARLRDKINLLVNSKCLKSLSAAWLPALNSALDQFVTATDPKDGGGMSMVFWQSMCKRGGTSGSGGTSWLNGWYNVFFPLKRDGTPNEFCVPYTPEIGYANEDPQGVEYGWGENVPLGAKGMEFHEMPGGMTITPLIWEFFTKKIPLEMRSGFVGATQRDDGTIVPGVGWIITMSDA